MFEHRQHGIKPKAGIRSDPRLANARRQAQKTTGQQFPTAFPRAGFAGPQFRIHKNA